MAITAVNSDKLSSYVSVSASQQGGNKVQTVVERALKNSLVNDTESRPVKGKHRDICCTAIAVCQFILLCFIAFALITVLWNSLK